MKPKPPVAKRIPVVHELHGRRREDPYAWLKDEDWQQVMREPSRLRADIREYLEAENAYARGMLAGTEDLQRALFEEMRARVKEDDASVPEPDGGYEYYERHRAGGQHPIVCRRRNGDGTGEEILLDGDAQAEGRAYFHLGDVGHSPDHALLGWTVDLVGSEIHTLRVKHIASGEVLEDLIEGCGWRFEWASDNVTLFYVLLDEHHRPRQVFRHRLGTAQADDVLVYEEPDPGFFVTVAKTESRRFVVIDVHDQETSESYLIDADAPDAPPVLVAPRRERVEYDVSHHGDRLLLVTSADGAEDFKLVEAPLDDLAPERWRELVPHRPGTLIVDFQVFRDYLVRLERVDGLPRVVVRELATGDEHTIAFDEEAYTLSLLGGHEFATARLRFSYSSMTTPQQVFDYSMDTRERVLRKTQEVPSGHDPADYVTRRVFATAHDGERVPVSVLYRRETPIDGSAPLFLYAYGAYGLSFPAGFSTQRLSLVDRGFVFAIAHVRGGAERGYRWYRQGKLANKRNTFLDCIAAAEHLAGAGFADRDAMVLYGASAGGMLVGAVLNMRPDLFAAAVAEVPFVDVLNTMCDESLPLTPPEWSEWGNPITDAQAYERIAGYSPYDNVQAKAYPPICVTAGLTDPRVTWWEPAKWVARLRSCKTDDHLLVLRTNMEAGHAGAAGRFERLREMAFVYAFVLRCR